MTRKILPVIVAALLAALSARAVGATESGQFPMTIENCGREVTIPQAPYRVLAMGGEAGSLIWAAGAADRITTFAELEGEPLGPAEDVLRAVPEILPAADLGKEAIVGAQPDVVITYGLNETTFQELEEAGIQTIFVSGYCDGSGAPQPEGDFEPFEGLYADIELYGRLFDTQDEVAKAVADLQARVAAVEEEAQDTPEGSMAAALFVPGEGPLGGYGNRSMAHAQMEKLGYTNVFAGADERYFEPSVEDLIAGDPDVLIALYQESLTTEEEAKAALLARGEIGDVTAVRNQDILVIDFFYTGHGVLAIEGLEILAEQLAALQ